MKIFQFLILFVSVLCYQNALAETKTSTTPQSALNRLMEGNKRFMQDQTNTKEGTNIRRQASVSGQKPFAIILGCSDSRVPPELAFDQSIGDIFVVRVAGNVVSNIEMESIEYSVLFNDSVLIMVLGHQNCGAVDAVLNNNTKYIETIAKLIEPAIEETKQEKKPNQPEETLVEAIEQNVENSVKRIKANPVIKKLVKADKLKVVGAYYHLGTGEVELLD